MSPPAADEIEAVLSNRNTIFHTIIDRPQSKTDLEDSLDCSRSTIDRAVRELRDAGLVRYEDRVWVPTIRGKYTGNARDRYLDHLENIDELTPLLRELSDENPITDEVLYGATVHTTNAAIPDLVMEKFIEYVSDAIRLRVITPAIVDGLTRAFYEQVSTDSPYELELLVTEEVFEVAEEVYADLIDTLLRDEHVEARRVAMPFSFGVWIADDDHVGIIVFTEHGIKGLIVNESVSALSWANEQFERVRESGETIFHQDSYSSRTP